MIIDPRRRPRPVSPALILANCLVAALPVTALEAQYGAIGLSGVGAQRFANEDLLFFEPQTGDHFAAAYAVGDFNGDGADDLATGIPHDNGIVGFEIDDCGAVVVRYGIPGVGLEGGLADTLLNQISGGGPDPAEAGDEFGIALAACDFNGDTMFDLAVGIRGEAVGSETRAGAVQVYYGAESGLDQGGAQFLTQNSGSIPGDTEAFEELGSSLACGDFDADGFDDLAIGVPKETFEGSLPDDPDTIWTGMVDVVYGSAFGLDPSRALALHQDTNLMDGSSEEGDMFGAALAVGNFDGNGTDDLAIGVPGEDGAFSNGRGAVQIVRGDPIVGLRPNLNVLYTEDELGGVPEAGDRLGFALAAGDFDGDLFTDLAVGVPFNPIGGGDDAGQVAVIYGSLIPFDLSGTQLWYEDVIHYPGASEAGDLFGRALVAGDFDRDGRDDLAIGEPGESLNVPGDGMVTVFMGGGSGLSNARRHGLAAGFHGNPGVLNQAFRSYGFALASGDFDGDSYADLAIGAPNEDEGAFSDVGATVVFYGSLFSDGLEVSNTGFWSDTTP